MTPLAVPSAATTRLFSENLFPGCLTDPSASSYRNSYDDPRMWAERYHEFEVGSVGTGVAIGDLDGDGWPDVVVVNKTSSLRVFRNFGQWRFQDVSKDWGLLDEGASAKEWKQGVALADVNNDGRLDIYVCRFRAPNQLYINQGGGKFSEEAASRGLALVDASVMGAFCDYDRDGWLDVYVATNMLDAERSPDGQPSHLFHNEGNGQFKDVSATAGIAGVGQAHSATWWDQDDDGWPDLYVANDFSKPDKLYRNLRNGTFRDVLDEAVPHTSFSSMGSDFGDVNNDGREDFLVADMAATTREKDQRSMAVMRGQTLEPAAAKAAQMLRNALYINTGGTRCAEAACLAGLDATDWTWSVRFEDLDNDGLLDLFVTNGMHREAHNADLMERMRRAERPSEKIQTEKASPVFREHTLAFKNLGGLAFTETGAAWGLRSEGVSFGCATGDLDGDGDMDLVYSRFDDTPVFLRNDGTTGNRLIVSLEGVRSNRFGIGAKVTVRCGKSIQVRTLATARGVLSTSEPIAHFGLGPCKQIDDLTVEWPSGAVQRIQGLTTNQHLLIREAETARPEPAAKHTLLTPAPSGVSPTLTHREGTFDETAVEPLLPARQDWQGPFMAAGRLDGGQAFVVTGGNIATPRTVQIERDGHFYLETGAFTDIQMDVDDGPILVLDTNGDGKDDILITKSGAMAPAGSDAYQPTLWRGDGQGHFAPAKEALPAFYESVGALAAADINADGTPDIFLGGRLVPGQYGLPATSGLWLNRGGKFEDGSALLADHAQMGRVTGAAWADLNSDGYPDLVTLAEWGTPRCFLNESGKHFQEMSDVLGFNQAGSGLWTTLLQGDFNEDGVPDFYVGNLGHNTPRRVPLATFFGAFRGNGQEQIVEATSENGKWYPVRSRRELGRLIPSLLKKYPKNDTFAAASLEEMVGAEALAQARRLEAQCIDPGLLLSARGKSWHFQALPHEVQMGPAQGAAAVDLDGNGHVDLLVLQNSFAPFAYVGRADGSLGAMLMNAGEGRFDYLPSSASGFSVDGDARGAALLGIGARRSLCIWTTRNQGDAIGFLPATTIRAISLEQGGDNHRGVGSHVKANYRSGKHVTHVLSLASIGGTQSEPVAWVSESSDDPLISCEVIWPDGKSSVHPAPLPANGVLTR